MKNRPDVLFPVRQKEPKSEASSKTPFIGFVYIAGMTNKQNCRIKPGTGLTAVEFNRLLTTKLLRKWRTNDDEEGDDAGARSNHEDDDTEVTELRAERESVCKDEAVERRYQW